MPTPHGLAPDAIDATAARDDEGGTGRLAGGRGWAALGPLRPEVAARTDRPIQARALNGIHTWSGDLERAQAAGPADLAVVSTRTGLAAHAAARRTGADTGRHA